MIHQSFLQSTIMVVLCSVLVTPGSPENLLAADVLQFAQADQKGSIDKLREELGQARIEIEKLKAENTRLRSELRRQAQSPQSSPTPAASTPSRPAPPIELPPLNLKETITVQDLIDQYKADPARSDARYKNQTFRIQGVVDRFEPPWVGLTHAVYLRGADRFSIIKCHVKFPGISDLAISKDGKTLSGSPPFRKEVTLLRIGEEIVFEGACAGMHDTRLEFSKCKPVR